jgi:hypothetical protein
LHASHDVVAIKVSRLLPHAVFCQAIIVVCHS